MIEASFNTRGRARTERARSLKVDLIYFASMDLNRIINSRGKKMIDICCVGSGVRYHSLSYWSIVMTSPVESFDRWNSSQTGMKSPLKWHINQQEKKNKGLQSLWTAKRINSSVWPEHLDAQSFSWFKFLLVQCERSLYRGPGGGVEVAISAYTANSSSSIVSPNSSLLFILSGMKINSFS